MATSHASPVRSGRQNASIHTRTASAEAPTPTTSAPHHHRLIKIASAECPSSVAESAAGRSAPPARKLRPMPPITRASAGHPG